MTARTLPEWFGPTPDTMPPPRVRLRVLERFDRRCQCGCNRQIFPGDRWHLDHTKALINGGQNREANLRPIIDGHDNDKTADDVAEKSRFYQKRIRHAGIYTKPSRPLPGGRDSNIKITLRHGPVDRRTNEPIRPGGSHAR